MFVSGKLRLFLGVNIAAVSLLILSSIGTVRDSSIFTPYVVHLLKNVPALSCVALGAYSSICVGLGIMSFIDRPEEGAKLAEEIVHIRRFYAERGLGLDTDGELEAR